MTKKGILRRIIFIGSLVVAILVGVVLYKHHLNTPTQPTQPTRPGVPTQVACTTHMPDEIRMTVFVHGSITHLVRKFNIETIICIARDKLNGTLYEKATQHMRNNSFFRRDQAMQDLGLQPIDKSTIMPGKAATALANIFDQIDLWVTGRQPDHTLYYTFGWDALVSEKIRTKNAQIFYQELFDEITRLKTLGYKKIVLQIYGFSHGGTVSLTLANVHYTKPQDKQISIDELILLGTPLHIKMYDQICSPLFKKIYNIYSLGDRAQKMDLTTPGFMSHHVFVCPEGKKLPDKLTQIQLSITRNRRTKKQWAPGKDPRFDFEKPSILHGSSDLFRRSSPSHVELWFFEWAICGYRDTFSLRPLPTVATVPLILDAVKKHVDINQRHFNVDIRPDQELFLIKTQQGHTIVPLLTHNQFETLKTMARAYEVTTHPCFEYDEHAKMAVMWAQQERRLCKINEACARQEHKIEPSTNLPE